jgi:hypothetical protein
MYYYFVSFKTILLVIVKKIKNRHFKLDGLGRFSVP